MSIFCMFAVCEKHAPKNTATCSLALKYQVVFWLCFILLSLTNKQVIGLVEGQSQEPSRFHGKHMVSCRLSQTIPVNPARSHTESCPSSCPRWGLRGCDMGMKNAMMARGSLDREDYDSSEVSGPFPGTLFWNHSCGERPTLPGRNFTWMFSVFFCETHLTNPLFYWGLGLKLALQLRAGPPAGMCIRLSLVCWVDALTKTFFHSSALLPFGDLSAWGLWIYLYMEVSWKRSYPIAGLFIRENPMNMDDFGVPPFSETSICSSGDGLSWSHLRFWFIDTNSVIGCPAFSFVGPWPFGRWGPNQFTECIGPKAAHFGSMKFLRVLDGMVMGQKPCWSTIIGDSTWSYYITKRFWDYSNPIGESVHSDQFSYLCCG